MVGFVLWKIKWRILGLSQAPRCKSNPSKTQKYHKKEEVTGDTMNHLGITVKKRKNHTHTLVKESTKGFHLRILLFFCFHKLNLSRLTLDKTDSWHHLLDIAMLQVWDLVACEVSQVGYSIVPIFLAWTQISMSNLQCYLLFTAVHNFICT